MPPKTMRAVVLKGDFKVQLLLRPGEHNANAAIKVAVEDRPYPQLQQPTDAILKVSSTALCGSDLHFYRGHLKCPPDFICGHEFVGEIVEKGESVKSFEIGDKVRNATYPSITADDEREGREWMKR